MSSSLKSPTEGAATAVYGGNMALDSEVCRQDRVQQDRARLDGVVEDITKDHGLKGAEKERAEEYTRKELHKLYEHPMVLELEAVLRKRITEDEARHVLFFPSQEQAVYYQALILDPPKGAPPEHPQRMVQIPHLSLLYLQHWKRWEFVSAFVLAGGMHSLCSLFGHDNPIVRVKAINTLSNITAHRGFDWFLPPPRHREGVTIEARLHRALLGLRSDPNFISGLIANSWGSAGGGRARSGTGEGGTFPGACLTSLQLLAMWLSWVRALHTADGTLRLSRPLLEALKEWGGRGGEREGIAWGKAPWEQALPQEQPSGEDGAMRAVGEERGGALAAAATTVEGLGDKSATTGESGLLKGEGAAGFTPQEGDKGEEKEKGEKRGPIPAWEGRGEEGGEGSIPAREEKGVGRGKEPILEGGEEQVVAETGKSSSEGAAEGESGSGVSGVMNAPVPPSPSSPALAQPPQKLKAGKISGDALEVRETASREDEEQGNEDPMAPPVVEEACRGQDENIVSTGLVQREDPVDSQLKMVIEAERKERAEVVKLAAKLVADFGRFLPAEEEWKEVVVERGKENDLCEGRRGHDDVDACASHLSAKAVPLGQKIATAVSSEQGVEKTTTASSKQGVAATTSVSIEKDGAKEDLSARTDANISSNGSNCARKKTTADGGVVETPVSKAVKEAGALKIAGNESFRAGKFTGAKYAYTAALDALDAAVKEHVSIQKEEKCLKEAVTLRGILHRNRAAVGLCMFEKLSAAAAATAGEKETVNSQTHGGRKTCGVGHDHGTDALNKVTGRHLGKYFKGAGGLGRDPAGEGLLREPTGEGLPRDSTGEGLGRDSTREGLPRDSTGAGLGRDCTGTEILRNSTGREPERAGRRGLPPSGEGRREGEEEAEEEEEEEEKALALLGQCERDCLSAIEIDAVDKKAHFRLARCREMRRRCRREGLAAALGEEKDVEQERRRRERKESLVAKILARTQGTHEIVGGTGGGNRGRGEPTTPVDAAATSVFGTVADSSRANDLDLPPVQNEAAATLAHNSCNELDVDVPLPGKDASAIYGTVPNTSHDNHLDVVPVEYSCARVMPGACGTPPPQDADREFGEDCDDHKEGSEGGQLAAEEETKHEEIGSTAFRSVDAECHAPKEGGELKGAPTTAPSCTCAPSCCSTPSCEVARVAGTESAACREEPAASRVPLAATGGGGGGDGIVAGEGKKLLDSFTKKTTKGKVEHNMGRVAAKKGIVVSDAPSGSAKQRRGTESDAPATPGAAHAPRPTTMGGTTRPNTSSSAPGIARADVAAGGPPLSPLPPPSSSRLPPSRLRNLRRQLEALTTSAVRVNSVPRDAVLEAGQEADRGGDGRGEEAKRVWDFISRVSLSSSGGGGSASLAKLYGDGITADSLGGLVHGLRYACGLEEAVVAGEREGGGERAREAADGRNNEQASKMFVQLAEVKRVSLASAMLSKSDKQALQGVSDHIRLHQRFQPITQNDDAVNPITDNSGAVQPIRGDDTPIKRDDDTPVRAGEDGRRATFEAAVSALGLV